MLTFTNSHLPAKTALLEHSLNNTAQANMTAENSSGVTQPPSRETMIMYIHTN